VFDHARADLDQALSDRRKLVPGERVRVGTPCISRHRAPGCYGLGVADDLESLMVYTSKQTLVPEPLVFIAKLPL
jgi:hypothetical protein